MNDFEEAFLLNTRFHKLEVDQLIDYILDASKLAKKTKVSNVNGHAINLAYELPWYRDFLNNSDLVFCDGFSVVVVARLLGFSVQSEHRMTWPDFLDKLAITCEAQEVSIFLLAGRPGVADKAIDRLLTIAPNLKVQGHHGYFEKTGSENALVIQKINEFKPDLLFVGFGMPLQERWISDNIEQIDTRVFLPCGACLDFYTGTVTRAPRWMTDRGLEGLSRVVIEPRRLWRRFLLGYPLLLYRVIRQRISNEY